MPIGGHLSAVFVELVALRREFEAWPPLLLNCPTTRYRDNFFVVLQQEPTEAQREATAQALSLLLGRPVGFERVGRIARCLELRITYQLAQRRQSVRSVGLSNRRRPTGREQGGVHLAAMAGSTNADGSAWLACWAGCKTSQLLGQKRGRVASIDPASTAFFFACPQVSHEGLAATLCPSAVAPWCAICCSAACTAQSFAQ